MTEPYTTTLQSGTVLTIYSSISFGQIIVAGEMLVLLALLILVMLEFFVYDR